MSCDLVDSTGIARDLVGAYVDTASNALTEMGGKVAKKLGEGLMALFGYPITQENDTEQAVRTALAIQRSLADLNCKNAGTSKPSLAARLGAAATNKKAPAKGGVTGASLTHLPMQWLPT
jgi:class 3 adenylate cyclase